jgi:hypothetical protein
MNTSFTMTFDCARPAALAAFWRLALGYVDAAPPRGFASWDEFFRHYDVPEEEWDDAAYLEDPTGAGATDLVPQGAGGEARRTKNRCHGAGRG